MDRLSLDQERVEELRTECGTNYPGKDTPLPGTALKLDDDVIWLGLFPMRVVWGYDLDTMFSGFSPEWFGDSIAVVEGQYITDRAPADPNETPMPIYPQQAQQPQGKLKHDKKAALKHVLKQLTPEYAKKVRALVKKKKPELLEDAK